MSESEQSELPPLPDEIELPQSPPPPPVTGPREIALPMSPPPGVFARRDTLRSMDQDFRMPGEFDSPVDVALPLSPPPQMINTRRTTPAPIHAILE